MNYIDPQNVISPRDCVSNVEVLYDGGADSVSLAKIAWEGKDCFAIRWNVAKREWNDPKKQEGIKQCVGMPTSRGYPVWFVLPEEMLDTTSSLWKEIFKNRARDITH